MIVNLRFSRPAVSVMALLIVAPLLARNSTSIAVSGSPNPATYGSPVTLNATVTPATATGRVTFYDGVTILGIAAVSIGHASFTTSLLPTGQSWLRAYYSGDPSNAPSTSAAVAESVITTASAGFETPVSIPIGLQGTPFEPVVVADFNGDGKPDFAGVSEATLYVFLNQGNGAFAPPQKYPIGLVNAMVAVDCNGDGNTDLIAMSYGGYTVFLGNGNGTFTALPAQNTGRISGKIVASDFNGDGTADLAVSDLAHSVIVIYQGKGDGTFTETGTYPLSAAAQSLAVADFNGDGYTDLVADNGSNVSVFLGKGDGTFQTGGTFAADQPYFESTTALNIAVADFNGDGRLDLAVLNGGSSRVGILLGSGDGTFGSPNSFYVGTINDDLVAEDLTGDGKLDLAVSDQGSRAVRILAGNGDGTFQSAVTYSTVAVPYQLQVADLNGDGTPDLLIGADTSALLLFNGANASLHATLRAASGFSAGEVGARYILEITNGGSYPTAGAVNVAFGLAGSLTATAMTGLGWTCTPASLQCSRSDALAVGGTFPALSVWVNVAANAPATITSTATVTGGNGSIPASTTASLSLPLLPSPAVTLSSSPNPSALGQAVTLSATISAGTGSVTFYDGATVLDTIPLNGVQAKLTTIQLAVGKRTLTARYDGDVAHAPATSAAVVQTVISLATGGFTTSTLPVGMTPYFVTAADLNGDGIEDVILTAAPSNVAVFLGVGNGTFQNRTTVSLSNYPNSLAVGDFNGDGKPDIAVAMNNAGMLAVLLGNGDGTLQALTYITIGTAIAGLAVADFDGDGKADLVVSLWNPGAIAVLLGNGDGTFQAPLVSSVGHPYSGRIVVGDFNGDRKPDVAVASQDTGQVVVLLGNGDGTFQAPANNAVFAPDSLTVADLNGDGKLDLVVGGESPSVYVLLGNGDGSFQPAVSYSAGGYNSAVAIGDFNGDGKLDVAVASSVWNYVAILLGNGDGTLRAAATLPTGLNPQSLAVGDFNGDGASDIVVADGGVPDLTVMLGTAGSGLQIRSSHQGNFTAGQTGVYTIVVANISLSPASGTLTVVDSLPAGLTATAIGGTGWTCALATATCSRSGGLATGASFPAIVVNVAVAGGLGISNLVNQATLTAGAVQIDSDDVTHIVLPSGISLQTSGSPSAYGGQVTLTATISGGTGKVLFFDSATVLGTATVSAGQAVLMTRLLPTGKRTLRATYTGDSSYGPSTSPPVAQVVASITAGPLNSAGTYATGKQPCCLVSADFNHDGRTDLAVLSPSAASVRVFLGNGDGTFQPGVDYAMGIFPVALAAGDLNGDGNTDLTAADQGGNSAVVLLGNGDGTFQQPAAYPICKATECDPLSIAVADVNGDGVQDLTLLDNQTYGLTVLLGNGDGTFQPSLDVPLQYQWGFGTMADLNGDGIPDLVTVGPGPDLYILLGNGDGTFRSPRTYVLPYPPPVSAAAGDLNGDGVLDLVVSNNTKSFSILIGNGDGTFQIAAPATALGHAVSAALGDLNGDGNLDVVTEDNGGNSIYALLGNGDGSLPPPVPYPVGFEPLMIALGDFNGDGRMDAAVLNYYDDTVSILLANPPSLTPPSLSITKQHLGGFTFGQSNAQYTVTVSNASGAGPTSGTVMVADNVPSGLYGLDMHGAGWSCPGLYNTCTRSGVLGPGQSYPPLNVTAVVSSTASSPLTNQVTVSGGGSASASAQDPATITEFSACDLNQDGQTNVTDIQMSINWALGMQAGHDLNYDGVVNVVDIQIVIAAVLGPGCGAS